MLFLLGLNILLLGTAVLLIGAADRASRRRSRCHQCGYDVRMNPERCPECGVFEPADITTNQNALFSLRAVAGALVVIAILLDIPFLLLLLL